MPRRQNISSCLLLILLFISLTGNIALFFWARGEASQVTKLELELELLRQEVEQLRQELEELRSQVQNEKRLQEIMEIVADRTEELRTLEPLGPMTRRLVSRAEMGQILLEALEEDYPLEEARQDEVILTTLELIPPNIDIYQTLNVLLEEQVAGLYDPDAETLYVVGYRGGMGPLEKVTFAHEYTHALQDQHFDLEGLGVGNKKTDLNDDQLLAIQALVEGDATFSMQQYMTTHFTPLELLGLVGAALTIDQTALNQAPAYFRQSLTFPYQEGLIFTSYLYRQGGWSAVDTAYANPPQSSEQILHPSRYPDDTPQNVILPPLVDTLGSDWQLVDENVLGEFSLRVYLDAYLTRQKAARGVEGWGGDRYAVYQNIVTEQALLALLTAWDSEADRDEFLDVYQEYARKRFGGNLQQSEEPFRIWWIGEDVLLLAENSNPSEAAYALIVLAPDVTIAEQVLVLFPDY